MPTAAIASSSITAIYTAAKEARRQEVESEISIARRKTRPKHGRAVARNLNEQFKQLELVFEQCRQHGEAMQAAKLATPPPRPKEAVELVPWPPHMRFD